MLSDDWRRFSSALTISRLLTHAVTSNVRLTCCWSSCQDALPTSSLVGSAVNAAPGAPFFARVACYGCRAHNFPTCRSPFVGMRLARRSAVFRLLAHAALHSFCGRPVARSGGRVRRCVLNAINLRRTEGSPPAQGAPIGRFFRRWCAAIDSSPFTTAKELFKQLIGSSNAWLVWRGATQTLPCLQPAADSAARETHAHTHVHRA